MAKHIIQNTKYFNVLLQRSAPQSIRMLSTNYQLNNKAWTLGKLNHVAIAVADQEKAIKMYRDVLGATVGETKPQHEHGVYTTFVELGDTKIELLYPLGTNSPVAKFLERNPSGGIHHICLEVSDIKKAMEDCLRNNIRPLDKSPKIGAHGNPVIFLHPKDCGGVLTELEEK